MQQLITCYKIQQKLTQKSKENAKNIGFLSNLIIGFLIISVAFACLYPIRADVEVSSIENRIYRKGNLTDGVSLLFNVYSDTDAVYSILETLEKHSAKATFFVGGCWADDNVDCLNAIKSKGHEIGNHGYFHKDHPSLTKQDNLKEISLCNEFVKKATGVIAHDDIVDELFAETKKELIDLIHKDKNNGEQATDLLMVAKYFERIGDHATNLAEWVIFSIDKRPRG